MPAYSLLDEVWQDVSPGGGFLVVENADLLKPAPVVQKAQEPQPAAPVQAQVDHAAALRAEVERLTATVERLQRDNDDKDRRLRARHNDTIVFFLTGAALVFVLDSFVRSARRS